MTGNGNHATYKMVIWRTVYYRFHHIISDVNL